MTQIITQKEKEKQKRCTKTHLSHHKILHPLNPKPRTSNHLQKKKQGKTDQQKFKSWGKASKLAPKISSSRMKTTQKPQANEVYMSKINGEKFKY